MSRLFGEAWLRQQLPMPERCEWFIEINDVPVSVHAAVWLAEHGLADEDLFEVCDGEGMPHDVWQIRHDLIPDLYRFMWSNADMRIAFTVFSRHIGYKAVERTDFSFKGSKTKLSDGNGKARRVFEGIPKEKL